MRPAVFHRNSHGFRAKTGERFRAWGLVAIFLVYVLLTNVTAGLPNTLCLRFSVRNLQRQWRQVMNMLIGIVCEARASLPKPLRSSKVMPKEVLTATFYIFGPLGHQEIPKPIGLYYCRLL